MAGTVYLVSTPIGNLEDITGRALRVLGEVDLIACEDTRHTQKLLNHYGIKTRTISYHEHNERERAAELLKLIESGADGPIFFAGRTPGRKNCDVFTRLNPFQQFSSAFTFVMFVIANCPGFYSV